MHIKSLLIGSAAALVAAPAFAADVIIAEPEPVEYVEVCDVAGAGFFYIPGSRTCLQISGLVRHQLDFNGEVDGIVVNNTTGDTVVRDGVILTPGLNTIRAAADAQDGYRSLVRAEARFRTFTETELGDLTSDIRFRANSINANRFSAVATTDNNSFNTTIDDISINNSVLLQNATIGLGGLTLGLTDSLTDYGIPGEFDSFGGDRVHTIRYTADLGAFSAAIAAELELADVSRTDYVPNFVAQVAGDVGPFSVTASVGYDDGDDGFLIAPRAATPAVTTFAVNPTTGAIVPTTVAAVTARPGVERDDEVSVKATASFDFGLAALAVGGTYNSGVNYYDNDYEFSAGASATFGLGEKASLTFGGQYFFNQLTAARFFTPAPTATGVTPADVLVDDDAIDGIDAFSVGANVDYEIVDGFDVKVAVNYTDLVVEDNFGPGIVVDDGDGQFQGFIRFDRSF